MLEQDVSCSCPLQVEKMQYWEEIRTRQLDEARGKVNNYRVRRQQLIGTLDLAIVQVCPLLFPVSSICPLSPLCPLSSPLAPPVAGSCPGHRQQGVRRPQGEGGVGAVGAGEGRAGLRGGGHGAVPRQVLQDGQGYRQVTAGTGDKAGDMNHVLSL